IAVARTPGHRRGPSWAGREASTRTSRRAHTISTAGPESGDQRRARGCAGKHSTRKGVDGQMGFFRVIGGLLVALLLVGLGAAIYQTGFSVGAAGAAGVAGGTAPVVV